MRRAGHPALIVAALLAAGCVLGDGDKTACMVDGDCRTGRVCRAGQCQAPGSPGDGSGDGSPGDGPAGADPPRTDASLSDTPATPDAAADTSVHDAIDDLPGEAAIGPDGCPVDQFRSGERCVSDIVGVAAALNRTCAVNQLGQVWCWGGSQLAVRPERQPGIEDARAVAVGGRWGPYSGGFACAVTRDGRVLCWGAQHIGQFGDGVMGISQRSTPAPVITADRQPLGGVREIALGEHFGCATTADKLHCWGENTYGQLAAPAAVGNGVVQYPGLSPPVFYRPYAAPVEGVSATAVGVGGSLTMSSDGQGTICGWGGNGSGHRYWPVLSTSNDNPVAGCRAHAEVVQLGGGFDGSCLRQRNGDVACWGTGVGVTDLPGQRLAFPAAASLAVGSEHACAALADGRAYCWGRLARGELGNGTVMSGSFAYLGPQQVTALGSDAAAVGSGGNANHTCAIKRDGSLHCWGRNDAGQLGNAEAPTAAPTPVPVNWL